MRNILPRLFVAMPDAITAAVFLIAWIAPNLVGPDRVSNLTLTMVMEFIVMHSSAFYAGLAASNDMSRAKRAAILTGLSAVYLIFIVGFSLILHSFWPMFAFAWLFGSRFMHIWTHPAQSGGETTRMIQLWVVSALSYIFGAIATVLLPLPAFGITPAFIVSMHLNGGGEWVERPYTVLAFGMFYFGVQAWAKYVLAGRESTPFASSTASSNRN
jgi:hypothetical protein